MSKEVAQKFAEDNWKEIISWLFHPNASVKTTKTTMSGSSGAIKYSVSGLNTGGSGIIQEVTFENKSAKRKVKACLKILREENVYNIDEYIKFFLEMKFLISLSSEYILPVYTKSFQSVPHEGKGSPGNEISKALELLLSFKENRNRNQSSIDTKKFDAFHSKIKRILDNPKFKSFVFYTKKKLVDKVAYLPGFMTQAGYPLEDILIKYSQHLTEASPEQISNAEDIDVPTWVFDAIKRKGHIPEEIAQSQGPTYVYDFTNVLDKLVKEILLAIECIHKQNISHLDIKEANIMAIPDGEGGIRFVLFDFGSAQEWLKINKKHFKSFESTYQYLPSHVQRLNPPSHFTSHKRVPIKWESLINETKIDAVMIDIHAFSRVIDNILTDSQLRRISSLIDSEKYEELFTFANYLSVDAMDEDFDSPHRSRKAWKAPEKLSSNIISRYNRSNELKSLAYNDWEEWRGKSNYSDDSISSIKSEDLTNEIRQILDHSKETENGYQCGNLIVKLQELFQKCSSQVIHPASQLFINERQIFDSNEEIKTLYNEFVDYKDFEKRSNYKNIFDKLNDALMEKRKEQLSFSFLGKKIDLSNLLFTPLIKRLMNIRQLGFLFLWPPLPYKWYAHHTRLDHCIGTVEITKLFLISLLKNSNWFRLRYENEDGLFLLLAALLHDIGHYPWSHALEGTEIFPDHETISSALINGDLESLFLNTQENLNTVLKNKEMTDILGISNVTNKQLKGIVDERKPYEGQYCDINAFINLHKQIKEFLRSKRRYCKFVSWYKRLESFSRDVHTPERLIFRVLSGVINGPVDADKFHYLVNDSIHCGLSLSSSLEGNDFIKLLNNLRIPYRQLPGCPVQKYCLGVSDESGYLPQTTMFFRASLYSEVYWSSRARIGTALLRHFFLESIRLLVQYGQVHPRNNMNLIMEWIGEWIRGSDENAIETIARFDDFVKSRIPPQKQLKGRDTLLDLSRSTLPFTSRNIGPGETNYNEICKIYPSDTVAYNYIKSQMKPIVSFLDKETKEIVIGKGMQVKGPHFVLINDITEIISEILQIPNKDLLYPGSVIVDIPAQSTSKKKEFTKFALVDRYGYGRPIGTIWDAIDTYFEESVFVIRIFVNRDVVVDQESSLLIREEILKRFS